MSSSPISRFIYDRFCSHLALTLQHHYQMTVASMPNDCNLCSSTLQRQHAERLCSIRRSLQLCVQKKTFWKRLSYVTIPIFSRLVTVKCGVLPGGRKKRPRLSRGGVCVRLSSSLRLVIFMIYKFYEIPLGTPITKLTSFSIIIRELSVNMLTFM